MRRWVLVSIPVVALGVVATAVFVATRPPPFDAFPAGPPSPSIAPDGSRVFTIRSGTEVHFLADAIDPGDVLACSGKGRTAVPQPGRQVDGQIRVVVDADGNVIASCAPHPLVAM